MIAKRIVSCLAAAASLLCACFIYALCRLPVFAGEGYELSCGASSSARVVRTTTPFLFKLTHAVAGESARFAGDVHAELLRAYRAEVLFTESAGGAVSYYCYSPLLGAGILLSGKQVNLHIAVGHGCTAAGTPVIFGGF